MIRKPRRPSPNGKLRFENQFFVNYFNILRLSYQIDNCQLPDLYACGVKRRKGAVLNCAVSPEPAR
jgi:hypothetical protein